MAVMLQSKFFLIHGICSSLFLAIAMVAFFCLSSPAVWREEYRPGIAFGFEAPAHMASEDSNNVRTNEQSEILHSTDPSKNYSDSILEFSSLESTGHGADASSAHERSRKIKLARHSFDSPLSKDASPFGEIDWLLEKSAVPTKKYVMLLPSLSNRSGQFWNKLPIKTTNFQLFFSFEILEKFATEGAYPEGFAFWIVYDGFGGATKSPLDVGIPYGNLFGYKTNPKGLGVFFKFRDQNGQLNPSISAIYNDGIKHISSSEIPTRNGMYHDFRYPNSPSSGIFQLSVGPNGVYGLIRTIQSEWITCFEMRDIHIEPNSFMGFSALSHVLPPQVSPAAIAIHSILVYNLDLSVNGEDNPDVQHAFHEAEIGDLLHNHSQYKNEVEVAESMRQLSRLIYQQIADQASRESQILRIVRSLLVKIQHLESSMAEMRVLSHRELVENSSLAFNSFHSEISGLKALLHKHTERHSDTLHMLQDKIDHKLDGETSASNDLKELVRNAKILEDTIHSRHSISSFMIIFLIVIVFLFGIFMWKRFRDMEKKHFL